MSKNLHAWDLTPTEAIALQKKLASEVRVEVPLPPNIRYIAGVDVSYAQKTDFLVAGAVVLDAETLEPLEQAWVSGHSHMPYIPGLLSFREIPPLLRVIAKLKLQPDLFVCDGHGIAHFRRLGVASHLGLWLDKPVIGSAKKALIRSPLPGDTRGDTADIYHRGELVGRSLRTRQGVKPVYVSAGHLVSLDEACEWILKLAPKWRLPETTRQADRLVGQVYQQLKLVDFPDAES